MSDFTMTTAEWREFNRTGRMPDRMAHAGKTDQPAKRTNKYGVGPRHLRQLDGYTFDSVAERKRYEVLRAMEKAGEIHSLRVHPEWPLVVNGVPVTEYQGDFIYWRRSGERVVEDVKGGKATKTRLYAVKKRLMEACHGIAIEEIET